MVWSVNIRMPIRSLSRDLKVAIEGKEWVMRTTKNDSLYADTINELGDVYNKHDITFTHNQYHPQNSTCCDEYEDDDTVCNDLALPIFGMLWFLTFTTFFVSQMLP